MGIFDDFSVHFRLIIPSIFPISQTIKGEKTIAQIAGEYGIHPNQIRMWRDRALAALPAVFSKGVAKGEKEHMDLEEELFRQIGEV